MDIVDQIADAARKIVAKLLFGKSFSDKEDIGLQYGIEDQVLLITLKRLIFEGKINEAENMLFERIKNSKVENKEYVILEFYTLLMSKSDEELEKMNFTREEIYEGIEDIRSLI